MPAIHDVSRLNAHKVILFKQKQADNDRLLPFLPPITKGVMIHFKKLGSLAFVTLGLFQGQSHVPAFQIRQEGIQIQAVFGDLIGHAVLFGAGVSGVFVAKS